MPTTIEKTLRSCKTSDDYRRHLTLIGVITPNKGIAKPCDDADKNELSYKLSLMRKYTDNPLVAETCVKLKSNIENYTQSISLRQ